MGLLAGIEHGARTTGILLIGLGLLSAALPALAGAPVMLFVGILLLLAGLARGWFGWRRWSEGAGPMGVLSGALAAACGLAVVANPVSTLETVASVVAIYMLVDGLAAIVLPQRRRGEERRSWVLGDAILSVLFGVSMWIGWPFSGIRALGFLVGAKLVAAGAVVLRAGRGIGRVGEAVGALRARLDG